MLNSKNLVTRKANVYLTIKGLPEEEEIEFDTLWQAELFVGMIPARMTARDPRLRGLQKARIEMLDEAAPETNDLAPENHIYIRLSAEEIDRYEEETKYGNLPNDD